MAGGTISREIRGRADEDGGYGSSVATNPQINESWVRNYMKTADVDDTILGSLGEESINYDFNPDLYHLSLPNTSAQYFMNRDGKEIIFPPQPIVFSSSVKNTIGTIYKKVVKDSKGLIYKFIDGDKSYIKGIDKSRQGEYITSWNLKEIESMVTGKTVKFNYEYDGTLLEKNLSQSIDIVDTRCSTVKSCDAGTHIGSIKNLSSETIMTLNRISSIEFSNGRIRFEYGNKREDVLPYNVVLGDDKRTFVLEKIIIEQKDSNNKYKEIKEYFFNHSYFNSDYTTLPISDTKKLKLDGITEIEMVNGEEKNTLFKYSDISIPSKKSYAQDFWGYYNGSTGNYTLIPPKMISTYTQTGGSQQLLGNSNRDINPKYIEAGILKEISYPTKGKTVFEYEPNTFYGKGFYSNIYKSYSISGGAQGVGNGYQSPKECPYFLEDYPDDDPCIDMPQVPKIKYIEYNIDSVEPVTVYVKYSITDSSFDTYQNKYSYAEISGPGLNIKSRKKAGEISCQLKGNGVYAITTFGTNISVGLTISYNLNEVGKEDNQLVGGLRIKSIKNFDINNNLINNKKYEYDKEENGIKKSTGYLVSSYEPSYTKSLTVYSLENSEAPYFIVNDYRQDQITTLLSRAILGISGNSVIYKSVREIEENEKGEKLITKYDFNVNSNIEVEGISMLINSFNRGQLLKRYSYKYLDNLSSLQLIEKVENNYTEHIFNDNQITGFKLAIYNKFVGTTINNYNSHGLDPNNWAGRAVPYDYTFTPKWITLDDSKTIRYFYNGNQLKDSISVTSYNTYDYNKLSHLQPISQTTTTSKGETLKTEYQYPTDLIGSKPFMQDLVNANRIAEPVITKSYNNSTLIAQTEKEFAKDATTNNLILPKFVYEQKGNQPLDKKITYDSYDTQGNITQYHAEDGIPVSIIWGYNGQYPIAKIEGVAYAQLSSYLTNISGIRTAFPQAQITTYTYEPLVGVTSITSPNNSVENYIYDSFGRLEKVTDKDGNVLKTYQYHYKP